MRIDAHAYIGHWPFRRLSDATASGLVERLDKFGFDQAWVGNLNAVFYKNCQSANEELAEAVKLYTERLVPFATLNPTYAGWEHDLDLCVGELGMRGLRLYPQYHGYELGDQSCMAIVRAARERAIPVAFTVRLVDERQQSWLDRSKRLNMEQIAGVIEQASDGKYLILHAFPNELKTPSSKRAIKNCNALFDTVYASGVPVGFISAYPLKDAVEEFGPEKFAFGTATPFRDYESHILRIQTFKEADDELKAALWGGNAARFLQAQAQV